MDVIGPCRAAYWAAGLALCAESMRNGAGKVRVGISGWRYAGWRGVFYPPGLPQRSELFHAAHCFSSIELNGSFYSLQRPEHYRQWYNETPEEFVFAVKGSRFITHMKKLNDVQVPLANFFASGVLCLEEKLGPFLWQFPPNFPFIKERFETFLELLPRTTKDAAKLAKRRDERVKGRSALTVRTDRLLRHAIEVRHESFVSPEFVDLARAHDAAIVVADTAGKWPLIEEPTSDFMYVRLHGAEELYVSGYGKRALGPWAAKVERWRQSRFARGRSRRVRDVYVYFDNDVKVHAPFDAMLLREMLEQQPASAAGRAIRSR